MVASYRLLRALLVAAVFAGCATGPPSLEPQYVGVAERAKGLEARAASYEEVKGRWSEGRASSTFTAYFAGRQPVIVSETASLADGGTARRRYYYENGSLFYVRGQGTTAAGETVDEQLFFDASGSLTHSHRIVNERLVETAGGASTVRHAAALEDAAQRARGPGYKIGFDLAALDDLGLAGPPLRAVRYEFCIPSGDEYAAEVRGLDPSVAIGGGSGCAAGQARCVGTTHQPAFRSVLLGIAALPYVDEIRETRSP